MVMNIYYIVLSTYFNRNDDAYMAKFYNYMFIYSKH